ncbi:protein mono-ADP-ribosyltransferase PARP14-like [Echeneis naucrates]|uniref:protein mono-ADP-ribosyltransferase PARP14-like n=1 Tax=Echeneis naucrates TaxID=173247 RepID=UPI001113CE9F|nr:protein mono-ADP-ribosyltransferase PARP14-like [Echeneis naucrates]
MKEKRVKLPTDLLTFISSSGAASKFQARFQQNLRNPVFLEVASDLLLSSLSSGALDEAWAALQRDLKVDTVKLQGRVAAPPDLDRLKKILIKAKNDANSQEFRVNFSVIPDIRGPSESKVRIVGYSENVNKLNDVLQEYQMNHVETEETVNLPHPEMVDCFDRIRHLIGMNQTKVTLRASSSPRPHVLVSGPRCHVQEAHQALTSALASLAVDTLVLDGPGAQRFFQTDGKVGKDLVESSCQVLIKEQQGVETKSKYIYNSIIPPGPSIGRQQSHRAESTAANKVNLRIKLGSLEDEQVDVLVIPMVKRQMAATKVGKDLLSKARNRIIIDFALMVSKSTFNPGEVLQIDGPPSLGCRKIFYMECLPWDGVKGQSVQALRVGLKTCLDRCAQQGFTSVAFPIIGPGFILKYPLREAIQALTESICEFGSSASSGSLNTIHVVIKPDSLDSGECYHEVFSHLSFSMNQGDQAIRSLASDLDEVSLTVGGGVKLQLVFGDITNETTDAVVNTTNFLNFGSDVCKDILAKAGRQLESLLKNSKVNYGEVFETLPGTFPCKAILHVYGRNDAVVIEQLVCRIIQHCESSGYKSVAIPAICAGGGGLAPDVVAEAILRGIQTATSSTSLRSLANIRLVLIEIEVFLAFKGQASQAFPCSAINTVPAPPLSEALLAIDADQSFFSTSSKSQPDRSVFICMGLCKKNVEDAMTKLKNQYRAQCATQTFTKDDLPDLTQNDINNLTQLVELLGLCMQTNHPVLTISGLKERLDCVTQVIHTTGSIRREARAREEQDLYRRVAWCILGRSGIWERLPETANRYLENQDVLEGIRDTRGILWKVDLCRMEARRQATGQTAKLKRLQNLPDFTFPLNWDNMMEGENLKVVEVQASSAEYWTVTDGFKRSVSISVNIMKMERLQNIHLLRAYEAQKKHISDKNGQRDAGEKLLYHGTSRYNADGIMKTGFSRSFAGLNATSFGRGTYFSINANYSSHSDFCRPAADGSKVMFVARVLTGKYSQGLKSMKAPPPINAQHPHDRYDSVVDNMDVPSMYVVFHDNQAYPDYLITFKET